MSSRVMMMKVTLPEENTSGCIEFLTQCRLDPEQGLQCRTFKLQREDTGEIMLEEMEHGANVIDKGDVQTSGITTATSSS